MLSAILLILESLLVGNELCIAVFICPTLYKLPDQCHLRAAKAIAGLLGRAMPIWYIATFALSVGECYVSRHAGPAITNLLLASTGMFLLSIIFTLIGPVPINNQIARLDPENPPMNWLALRKRWDILHAIRTFILFIALFLLVSALLLTR
ncbi:MAG TPA: DUF1772 domain-containing protein [Tepidisphaeraceae bacterium]|jgi:hypothetical protein